MVKTIRPHGAIKEDLVQRIFIDRDGRFALIDDIGNRYGIDEETFILLKERGVKVYEIKQSNNL